MNSNNKTDEDFTGREFERLGDHLAQRTEPLIVERTFEAPAGRVWAALTTREAISQWSFEIEEFKPEIGFEFQFYAGKDDDKYLHCCKVTDVIPQKRLAYSWRYDGYAGDSLVIFDLFAEGDKTRVRLTHLGLETFPPLPGFARNNFLEGWTQIVGVWLKEFVEDRGDAATRKLSITRIFDAPRERVFEAWTRKEHIEHWMAPNGFTIPDCDAEFREGGAWRCCMIAPDGTEHRASGVYQRIVPNELLVFTHAWLEEDGERGHETVATVRFADRDGKTEVTFEQGIFKSQESRDGHYGGWNQCLDRLGGHLAG